MSNQEIWLEDADGRRLPPGSQGELVVRGTHVMDGYWQRPAETAAVLRRQDDGRRVLRTGDEFLMDADGYLYFLGRRDDLVKVGGRRISTGTVERAIRSMAEVDEVAVIACEDDFGDDSLTAFVCTRPGHELVAQQVMRSCRRVLESAAVPRRVLFVATLPRNPHGKIDVPALRALASVAQSSVG
jgi:acyl-coenzyme A synthetase/AMP-(fatty) acid ligase